MVSLRNDRHAQVNSVLNTSVGKSSTRWMKWLVEKNEKEQEWVHLGLTHRLSTNVTAINSLSYMSADAF